MKSKMASNENSDTSNGKDTNLPSMLMIRRPIKSTRFKKSNVLQHVKEFLPKMAKANEELEKSLISCPDEVNIEKLDDHYEGPVIEMNFALVEMSDTSDSDDPESSSDDESDEESDEDAKEDKLRTSANTAKPHIEVISSTDDSPVINAEENS